MYIIYNSAPAADTQGFWWGRRGRSLSGAPDSFLTALNTLVSRLTACALSVTCGDSSPKGRAKSTTESFLMMPNTLATDFKPWLSLRGKTSPAPGEDVTAADKKGKLARERLRGRARLAGAAPHPALRTTFPRRVKASAVAGRFLIASETLTTRLTARQNPDAFA